MASGGLTPFFSAFFDTTTGAKRDPDSDRRIAAALGVPPPQVLFLSDVVEELDAAREAGLLTRLVVREGAGPPDSRHAAIRSFDEIEA